MSDVQHNRRKPPPAPALGALLAVALAGCGGAAQGLSTSAATTKPSDGARDRLAAPGSSPGARSGSALKRYTSFAACMRKHGIELPAPDASGKGPIFDTRGIDTGSPAFRAADTKCVGELRPARASGPGG